MLGERNDTFKSCFVLPQSGNLTAMNPSHVPPESPSNDADLSANEVADEEEWEDDDLAKLPGRIWARGEVPILEGHLEQFTKTKSKKKTEYIRRYVLEDIRTFWGSRYSKTALKDNNRNKEWKKKKQVTPNP